MISGFRRIGHRKFIRRFFPMNLFPTIDTVQNKPNLILYHGSCPDGFGAAFCAWRNLRETATYQACSHGQPPPNCVGKHVAVFDFCWSTETLRKVQSEAASFILFDHHASAMKENGGEPNCYFEMKKSGATLAWDFFFPNKEVPPLIQFVEDRDLWNWKIPNSKEFNVAQDMVPFEFPEWEKLLDADQVQKQIEKGKVILDYKESLVSRIAEKALKVEWEGKNVYSVNSCVFHSEVGNVLSMKPDCNFAAIWEYHQDGKYFAVSLRSSNDIDDVSVVAKKYGGGGHPRAAGMRWDGPNIESLFESKNYQHVNATPQKKR